MSYKPVVNLPEGYLVFDLSQGPDPRSRPGVWGIGKYGEKRAGTYTAELFKDKEGVRDIHLGVDISAPTATPFHAFDAGEILFAGYNSAAGDYGFTLVTKHEITDTFRAGIKRYGKSQRMYGTTFFVLWGHLSEGSITTKKLGQKFVAGEELCKLGDAFDNGGWPPHLHIQISLQQPDKCDLPGTANEAGLDAAMENFPDPRIILGALY